MYYDNFYEPSEFETLIDELKDTLRKSVKAEYQKEMEYLRNENKELLILKQNWDTKCKELKRKMEDADNNAKKARLYELLKPFSEKAWAAQYKFEYLKDKCDKCDERGYIHYKTPMGRDASEKCECRQQRCVYYPVEVEYFILKQRIRGNRNSEIETLFRYRRHCWATGDEDDEYSFVETDSVYCDQPFEDINPYSGMIFMDKGDCERYCAYLNARKEQE